MGNHEQLWKEAFPVLGLVAENGECLVAYTRHQRNPPMVGIQPTPRGQGEAPSEARLPRTKREAPGPRLQGGRSKAQGGTPRAPPPTLAHGGALNLELKRSSYIHTLYHILRIVQGSFVHVSAFAFK